MLLSLDYLTSLFSYIPKSALAAVIVMAVAPLFDARIFATLWRVKSTYVLVRLSRLLVRARARTRPGFFSHRLPGPRWWDWSWVLASFWEVVLLAVGQGSLQLLRLRGAPQGSDMQC